MMRVERGMEELRRFLSIFSAYLVVNFFANLILIVFYLNISSIGSVFFSAISTILPLISLIETVVHFKKCLKFLADAREIKRRLISRKTIFKVIFIIFVLLSQLFVLVVRRSVLKDLRCDDKN